MTTYNPLACAGLPFRLRLRSGLWLAAAVWLALAAFPGPSCAGEASPADTPREQADEAESFGFAEVERIAAQRAETPYAPPETPVPDFLLNLTLDEWRAIRARPDYTLWSDGQSPFRARFLHPGSVFDKTLELNVIEEGGVTRAPFSPGIFDIADEALAEQIRETVLGFAGFVLDTPAETTGEDVAGLVGTSHFVFKGRNARHGAYARILAIDTALPKGETFPYFRELWLVKPKRDDTSLVFYALMDSPAMTGAFRMEATPGTSMVMTVGARLYRRKGAPAPEKIGLAPITGMFMHSESSNAHAGDYRPEVHNCDGLQVRTADEAWHWVPLKNPGRLTINTLSLPNPRGFGLLQRDDNFDHYQDLDNRYDRSSSLWVEPIGNWGPGRLELVEIPAGKEYHGNILAYWVPEANGAAANGNGNGNGQAGAGPLALEYRLYWMTPGVSPHTLGRAAGTRIMRSPNNDVVTFVVDFESESLNALTADTGLTSVVEAPEEAPLEEKRLVKNSVTGGWRLYLRFKLPQGGVLQSLLNARNGPPPLRFSAHIKKGENLADPLTETWAYTLYP